MFCNLLQSINKFIRRNLDIYRKLCKFILALYRQMFHFTMIKSAMFYMTSLNLCLIKKIATIKKMLVMSLTSFVVYLKNNFCNVSLIMIFSFKKFAMLFNIFSAMNYLNIELFCFYI